MLEAIIMIACVWAAYWLGGRQSSPPNSDIWLQTDIVRAARQCKMNSKFHGSEHAITVCTAVREIEGDKYVIGVARAQSGWKMVMEYKGVMHD